MPGVRSAILFLGERSPYGLSVALAVLASKLPLRRVIVPSDKAYDRILARAARADRARSRAPSVLLRRALRRTRSLLDPQTAEAVKGGEPILPPLLHSGTTAQELETTCRSAGIDWQAVDDVRSGEFAAGRMRGEGLLILSAAFPLILTQDLISAAPSGAINFHPSLLPRCRGCHPIYWTLASGESQGGVTAHFMTPEVDAGNILAQIALPLTEADDYESLYRRAMEASGPLVEMVERFLASGGGHGIPQDLARATYFHEDTESDHRVNWSGRSPHEIIALARTGQAFTTARGERLGILKAAEVHTVARERRTAPPGRVLAVNDDALVVEASGGAVALRALSWRGRRHGGGDLARALGVRRGEVLG